jgi:hypothetical protein
LAPADFERGVECEHMTIRRDLEMLHRVETARSHAAIASVLDELIHAPSYDDAFLGRLHEAVSNAHSRLRDIDRGHCDWADSQVAAACEALGRVMSSEAESRQLRRSSDLELPERPSFARRA